MILEIEPPAFAAGVFRFITNWTIGRDMMGKYFRSGSISAGCFEEFCNSLDLFFTFGYRPIPALKYGFDQVFEWHRLRDESARRQMVKRWKRKELIKIRKHAGALEVTITDRGALELARLLSVHTPILEGGQICLIVFDIPESCRKTRLTVRNFLRSAGFEQVQLSVWSTRRDVRTILENLRQRERSFKWIRMYLATELNNT